MLTKDEAKTVLARIIAENPDRVNPSDGLSCLYWDEDWDGNITRCIVGQMAHELGWPEPRSNATGVIDLCGELMLWNGLANGKCQIYLNNIQTHADGTDTPLHDPIRWEDIKL